MSAIETVTDTVTLDPSVAPVRRLRPVSLVGAAAGTAAAVATELLALSARALGVPMAAGNIGEEVASPLPPAAFAMGTLTCVFYGTILAMVLARFARRPSRTFLRVALVLTALSLLAPAAAPAALATKLVLGVAHLLAAAIVIPPLSRRLRRVHPRR